MECQQDVDKERLREWGKKFTQTMPQYSRQLSAIVVTIIAESATHASSRTCVGIGFTAIRGIVNHHRVLDAVVRGPPHATEFDRRDAPNGVDARPLEDTDLARAAPSRTDGAQHRHTPSCRTTIAKDIGGIHLPPPRTL